MHIWLRAESRNSEMRSPLTPSGASSLLAAGHHVTVESSGHRIYSDQSFKDIGCQIVASGAWTNAPGDAYILGLKELSTFPVALKHNHIFFGHAYKGQPNSQNLIARFRQGGGKLLDLEYMCDEKGNRVVAFGYWAGYVGTALALLQHATKDSTGIDSIVEQFSPFTDQETLNSYVESTLSTMSPRVLIIGAHGRCGLGAQEMCHRHGISPTLWGRNETLCLNRSALLAHDVLINCALITHPIEPFLRAGDLSLSRQLSVISDVSCDQGSILNPLPIMSETTTWDSPVRRLYTKTDMNESLDFVAIDNLASILPRESSEAFSKALLPYLLDLQNSGNPAWVYARNTFNNHSLSISPQQCSDPGLRMPCP